MKYAGWHPSAPGALKRPSPQVWQSTLPPALNLPAGQRCPDEDVPPTAQPKPGSAVHSPLQLELERPGVSPYRPAGHGMQSLEAPDESLKDPAGQGSGTPTDVVEPAGHQLPAGGEQGLHGGMPETLYHPTGHSTCDMDTKATKPNICTALFEVNRRVMLDPAAE